MARFHHSLLMIFLPHPHASPFSPLPSHAVPPSHNLAPGIPSSRTPRSPLPPEHSQPSPITTPRAPPSLPPNFQSKFSKTQPFHKHRPHRARHIQQTQVVSSHPSHVFRNKLVSSPTMSSYDNPSRSKHCFRTTLDRPQS